MLASSTLSGLTLPSPVRSWATTSMAGIAAQWDANVQSRANELETGMDRSYFGVLMPTIVELLLLHGGLGTLIDVGCGLGYLTEKLNNAGYEAEGVDISSASIEYASSRFPNTRFTNISVEDFAAQAHRRFDVCLANMVFHNVLDLDPCLHALSRLIRPGGLLVYSIPHPLFWPLKRIRCLPSAFRYYRQEAHSVPFKISNGNQHPSPITYVHRPIASYLQSLAFHGFNLLNVREAPGPGLGSDPDILTFAYANQRPMD